MYSWLFSTNSLPFSSEGVLRQDRGEPKGEPRNMQKTVTKKGQRIYEEKKFLMVKAIMVFSLLFPYSRRGNVSSSKSTLIVIFFLVMSQLLHTFFPL